MLGMDRPWISAGLRIATVTNADVPSYLLQRVAALRPLDDRIHPSYLRLWLERDLFRDETLHSMTGVAVPHISGGQIEAYRIAVPPRDEQDACVAEFERASTQRAAVESAVRDLGARLAEYRDALITEAVTGQLDVTTVSDAQMDERLHRRADAAST